MPHGQHGFASEPRTRFHVFAARKVSFDERADYLGQRIRLSTLLMGIRNCRRKIPNANLEFIFRSQ